MLVNDFVFDIRIGGGGGVLIATYLLQALHLLSIVLYDQLLKVAVKSSSLLFFCHLCQLCLCPFMFIFLWSFFFPECAEIISAAFQCDHYCYLHYLLFMHLLGHVKRLLGTVKTFNLHVTYLVFVKVLYSEPTCLHLSTNAVL